MKKYQIYKINAEDLRVLFNKNKKYEFDFNDKYIFNRLVSNTIFRNDNALFYQITKVLNKDSSDVLLNHLLYIDFKQALRNDKKDNLKYLFDNSNLLKKGLTITCLDGVKRNYLAFDKSNDMSKKSCIYFIDAKIKQELDTRLLLNFPFDKMLQNPSKYFSYRGLYLSDSKRIDNIELNEKNVIVIPDNVNANKQDVKVITAKAISNTTDLEFIEKPFFYSTRFNRFDGEGFISIEYSKKINEFLNINGSSYQIRMPFTKGMLHSVDLIGLYNEFDSNNVKSIKIIDYYGILRNLDDVQIILTESMFKCAKWLKQYRFTDDFENKYKEIFNNEEYDVMKLFFYFVNKFNHHLYVGETNEDYTLQNKQMKTTLNYQFINTLDLKQEEFDELLKRGISEIDKAKDSYLIDINDEDDIKNHSLNSIYKEAVSINKHFLKDPRISNYIKSKKIGIAKNIGIGKIITEGENRFLSSDLLSLFIHLVNLSKFYDYNDAVIDASSFNKRLSCELIHNLHFYMPSNYIELSERNYYAILRNPHLSRNEEVIAKPYIPSENSIMYKYFSHLNGIIMVSSDSLIPSTLGGADYDGDLVKIYSSPGIVNSIIRGCYKKQGNHLYRKLPIVEIPSLDSDNITDDLDSISYKLIKDTFDSKIGMISNCSTQYGELSRFANMIPNYQARCSIIAGLEIDAAKKGWHPIEAIEKLKANLNEIIQRVSDDRDILLPVKESERKKFLESLVRYFIDIKDNISSYKTYYKIFNNSINGKYAVKPKKGCSYLYSLPYLFVESYNRIQNEKDNGVIDHILFKFEKNESWKDELDDTKISELKILIKTYKKYISYKQENIVGKYYKLRDDKSYIYNCLQNIYQPDIESYVFKETNSNLKVALDDTFHYLEKNYMKEIKDCKDYKKLYEIIKKDLNKKQDKSNSTLNTYLMLFNPNFTDGDNYLLLFKYIVNYVIDNIDKLDVSSLEDTNIYSKEFNKIIINATTYKQRKNVWSFNIKEKAKEFLYKNIFENNRLDAVKYVYSLRSVDNKADFFWDVLDREDIKISILENKNAR